MGFGKILGMAALGVGAVAAAPFTGGGSILAATSVGASLAGAGAMAGAAGAAGAAAGAVLSRKEEEEERKRQREIAKAKIKADKATQTVKMHERHTKLILALTALGVAMANADGEISKDEMADLNDFVGGLSSSAYPEHIVQQIKDLIKNPLSFNEAIEYLKDVDSVEYPEIRNLLEVVMEADGKVANDELGFLYAYDKKVKELTA